MRPSDCNSNRWILGRHQPAPCGNRIREPLSLQNFSVLIVTDEPEFARLLTACWRAERDVPAITVLASDVWNEHEGVAHELAVVGPLRDGKLQEILHSL